MTRFALFFLLLILSHLALNARKIHGVVLSAGDSTAVVVANCGLMADGKLIFSLLPERNISFYFCELLIN